jgi:MATE family multidrug resistance protein
VPAAESGTALLCAPQPALLQLSGLAALGGAMAAGAATVALESWPLEVSNLVAGLLDVPSLDAHAVVLNVCVFISLGLPTGLAVAASARIPALLAAGDGGGAKRAALVAVLTTLSFNLLLAFAMLAVRGAVGAIFTPSKEVAALCARAVLLAALFQVADGLQCVMGGVLRALGWGRAVTALLFACWAGVGLPLGGALAVGYGMGVAGLWAGLAAGVAAVALAFAALLHGVDWDAEAARAKRLAC